MNTRQWALIGGAAVMTILIAAAALLLIPDLLTSKEVVVVGELNRDGDIDLSLLNFGDDLNDGLEIDENVFLSGCEFIYLSEGAVSPSAGGTQFLPGTDDAILCIQDEDEILVLRMGPDDEAPLELLDADGWVTAFIYTGANHVIYVEDRGDQQRCYLSENGEEADRIAKGDSCIPTLDGSAVITADRDSDGLTLAITDVRSRDEVELFDEESTYVDFRISYDGSRIALLENDDGDVSIKIMDTSDGELVAESDDEYTGIHTYGFNATENNVYAVAENEDGMLVLLVSNANRFEEIAESEGMQASPAGSGRYLIYELVDEDGDTDVYSYDFSRGESVVLFDGELIQYAPIQDSELALILEQDMDEYTLHSVPLRGGDAIELYSVDDVYNVDVVTYPGFQQLFISSYGEDGISLFVTPVDAEEGYLLLDEWYDVQLSRISSDGHDLLFVGQEDDGDDLTLFAVELSDDARPVELDDDMEDIFGDMILYSRNEKEVIYTVSTGDRLDDIEVRVVRLDRDESPDELYDEAVLFAAVWDDHRVFEHLVFSRSMMGNGTIPTVVEPPSPQPTPSSTPTISGRLQVGDSIMDEITNEAGDYWSFTGQTGDEFVILLNGIGGLDPVLELLDSNYNMISTNDDGGEGRNALLEVSLPESGTYIIRARGYSGATGSYELALLPSTAMVPTATPAPEPTSGPVDSPDSVTLTSGSSVRGMATSAEGDEWTLEIGSEGVIGIAMTAVRDMDTYLELYDARGNLITSDDDGGEGFNSYLFAIIPEPGTYYVVARGFSGDTGEYILTVEDMSSAMQGTLSLGETVNGELDAAAPVGIWNFEGQQGDLITIAMDGFSVLDTTLELLGPDGTTIRFDDDGGAGYNSLLMARLETAGTYTILARGFGGDLGAYTLSLSSLADIQGTLSYNTPETGELTDDQIGELWSFEGQAGDIVAITMNGDVTLDPFVTFFSTDLYVIGSNEGTYNGLGPSIFWNMLQESGTYYVMAGRSFGAGAYDITLYNIDAENQPVRQPGDSYTRTLESALGNIDVIQGSRGDRISIAMNAIDEMDPIIGVFDSDWNLLITDDDSGEGLNALISGFVFPEGGLYYLVELSLDNAIGDYEMVITEGDLPPVD